MKDMRKPVSTLAGVISRIALVMFAALIIMANADQAVTAQEQNGADAAPVGVNADTFNIHLPILMNDIDTTLASRLGYGAGIFKVTEFPEVRSLKAGWYVDWGAKVTPLRPGGIEYMPMVRLHQNLTCPVGTTADRKLCPYVEPHSYSYSPDKATIEAAAKANPGSIWFVGNEMDRLDWPGGSQDEMLPTLYPVAYHEIYNIIKGADPTAKVAIGGIIQMTPMRKQYLDIIWAKYKELYGVKMPVDVWNVHNFIGSEFCEYKENSNKQMERICYGMATPPGIAGDVGSYYGEDWRHIDHETFDEQIRAMRQWIKDNDDMNKPMYVTEYGVLYGTLCPQENPEDRQDCIDFYGPKYVELDDPAVIQEHMLWTFEYFRTTKDCNLSGTDDCRLVQRWAWYSLQDDGWNFNPHTALFSTQTRNITSTGAAYRDYAQSKWQDLRYP